MISSWWHTLAATWCQAVYRVAILGAEFVTVPFGSVAGRDADSVTLIGRSSHPIHAAAVP